MTLAIVKSDVETIQGLMTARKGSSLVKARLQRNVLGLAPTYSRDNLWQRILTCLLTTQQPSGPGTAVNRFIKQNPFPLALTVLRDGSAERLVIETLSQFGGIRRYKNIANEADYNLRWLRSGGWTTIETEFVNLAELRSRTPRFEDITIERRSARLARKYLKGFGPKQARNLWQMLGLTRFEIPLDSRVTKWISSHLLLSKSINFTPRSLVRQSDYELTLDGIQALCREADILPCLLDAAIFSSYDREWQSEELIY